MNSPIVSILRAYVLAFVAVLIVTFGRGYMLNALDAGDSDTANILMVFGIVFGAVPAILLIAAAVAEITDEE